MHRGTRPKKIVVVGAGLAGLACAQDLWRAGHNIQLYEMDKEVGGRLRTNVTAEGYRLDRGFQVLLAGYPAIRRRLPIDALQPRYFASALQIAANGVIHTVAHPFYAATALPATVTSGLVAGSDLRALTGILLPGLGLGDSPFPPSGKSSRDLLRDGGVSESLFEQVLRPFFAGISLDPELSSDGTLLRFVLRALTIGRVFLPALGIGEFPCSIAASLPSAVLHLGCPVQYLLRDGDRVAGVRVEGRDIDADAVVLATEASRAGELGGLNTLPAGSRGCVTAYFASDRPLYAEPRLALNAGHSLVNHVAQLTNVAPSYAPPGKHLLAAVALGDQEMSDEALAAAMLEDVRSWHPGGSSFAAHPVGLIRVPYSQFAQPPGIFGRLPEPQAETAGLFLAGEFLHSSSVQGALRGGELAARAVIEDLQYGSL